MMNSTLDASCSHTHLKGLLYDLKMTMFTHIMITPCFYKHDAGRAGAHEIQDLQEGAAQQDETRKQTFEHCKLRYTAPHHCPKVPDIKTC